MKTWILILLVLLGAQSVSSQPKVVFNDSIPIKADQFVGIDSFGSLYFIKENILYKKWKDQQWQFGDFILGELTRVSILNPLKILLFYESSNTIVYIDKYFTEIDRIDFNTLTNFKNLAHVSPANDRQLWIFDINTQQLEVFDTDARKSIAITQPLSEIPETLEGNFNFCWLLSSQSIAEFNIYGSLLQRFENQNFSGLQIYKNGIILLKDNTLYYRKPKSEEFQKITLPKITIKQFYVRQEILYIYDQKTIYSFNLTPQ